MTKNGISQEDAEEKARERLISETRFGSWEVFYKTSGPVNWVFKFRGGFGEWEREYLVWVNRTDGSFSRFKQLE